MIFLAGITGLLCMHFLLKTTWKVTAVIGCYLLLMYHAHARLYRKLRIEQRCFEDVCVYLESLLYSFLREGKIIRAFEDVSRTLAIGEMQETVNLALEKMEMVTDETEIYREAMDLIAEKYECRRVRTVHEFLLHVEYYGGDMEQAVELLIEDKNRWQSRIQTAMKERAQMFREIIMSVGASLLICGAILHLPILDVDVSKNLASQIAAVVVIVFNDLVILRGQNYLAAHWITFDDFDDEKNMEDQIIRYRNYDDKKGRKQSFLLAVIPIMIAIWNLKCGQALWACLFCVVSLILLCQHKIGHQLAGKNLKKRIQSAFPQWIMDLILLLQSENVHVALVKSKEHVPMVLRNDLEHLIASLEMDPESVAPYHKFLKDFEIPEVHAAMSALYSLSEGNCGNMKGQLSELVKRNLEMMNLADGERMKEKNSGMYLLFLAPVLVASIKLLVDMAIFLLTFLTMGLM